MKKIDKKDLPKLIGLIFVSVVLFGFAVAQFLAPTTSAGTPEATGALAEASTTGTPDAENPDGSAKAETPDTFAVEDIAILTSGKDPFVPNGPAAPLATLSPQIVPSRPPRIEPLPPSPEPQGGAPPYFSPPSTSQGPSLPPFVPEPPPPPPAYTVTGIVRGDNSVAILRGGNGTGERRFVRAGDPVGNGFTVVAVRRDGVVIKSGDRRVVLKLGGDSRAK